MHSNDINFSAAELGNWSTYHYSARIQVVYMLSRVTWCNVQNRISLLLPPNVLLICPAISCLFPLAPYPHVPLELLPHHPQPSPFLLTICGGHAHTSCSWYVGNIPLWVE